uniref:Fatty acyl-CoA reductase n=1 Tax=Heliothis virescens TaxID=7102 RepID=A0A2A4JS90_HELVI
MLVDMITQNQLFEAKQGGDITFMDMVDEREALGESKIQKMFAGSSVLLTGGTGFLGKLVVEKLLRSCPDLKKIYLLARPKKNKDITKRLQEQFDDVLYDKLRKECPNFIQKIRIVEGDMGQLELGMCPEDRIKIMNEVDVIFHGAATVRFDEPLKTAVEINVRGTREMFKLARGCTKLKAFVHISTAYSNCPQTNIDEKFYDSPLPGDKLIDMVETIDARTLDSITPGLLGDFPNTYAYTKAVAENIVLEYSQGLPVALFRPSIVIGTAKEPVSGWIDNVYGPTGVVVGAAVGLLHVLNCDAKVVADLVPGDMVVCACIAAAWRTARDSRSNHEDAPPPDLPPPVYNYVSSEQKPLTWGMLLQTYSFGGWEVVVGAAVGLLHVLNCDAKVVADLVPGDMVVCACIAAAWRTARDSRSNHEDAPPPDLPPPVYNYVSSEQKPLTWEKFMHYNEVYGFQVPTVQAIYYYLFTITSSRFLYTLYCFLLHWVPAYIIDGVAVIIGKKPMLRKAYTKITKFSEVMAYFATREWKFDNSNTQKLYSEMCEADKHLFDFDMSTMDWNDYFYNYIRGVRVYLLKDPVDTVPAGLKKLNRLRLLHYTFCVILGLLFLRVLWAVFSGILGISF